MKRIVRNIRHVKYQNNLPSLNTRVDLIIPEEMTKLKNGEEFLFDSGNDNQHIIVLGTEQTLDILQGALFSLLLNSFPCI